MFKKNSLLEMLIVDFLLFFLLVLVHGVIIYISGSNLQTSLNKAKSTGLLYDLEEVRAKEVCKDLSPKENIAELLKSYRAEGWWSAALWTDVSQKKIEGDIEWSKEEKKLFYKVSGKFDKYGKNKEAIKNILKKKQGTINLLYKMADCKGYYMELDKEFPLFTPMPELLKIRETAELMQVKMLVDIREGKENEAFDDLRKMFRWNEMLNYRASSTLLGSMIRIAVNGINLDVTDKLIKNSNLSNNNLDELLKQLIKTEKLEYEGLTSSLNMERLLQQDIIKRGIASELENRSKTLPAKIMYNVFMYIIKPLNNIERIFQNEYFYALIKNAKQPVFTLEKEIKIPRYFIMSNILLPDMLKITKQAYIERNKIRLAIVKILLKMYKNKIGFYPENLSELKNAAGYDVPSDIMKGGDFYYKKMDKTYELKTLYEEK